jgi:hypothetical protein
LFRNLYASHPKLKKGLTKSDFIKPLISLVPEAIIELAPSQGGLDFKTSEGRSIRARLAAATVSEETNQKKSGQEFSGVCGSRRALYIPGYCP